MEELSLTDYLSILKRRKLVFVFVAGVIFFCSFVFALNWSNYRSIATVEIALSEIDTSTTAPNEASTIADLRISRIQQKVFSTGSLIDIIKKYNLYEADQASTPLAKIAENMHKKIKVNLVGSQLANPASAQKATAGQLSAIAFTLSFDYSKPHLAQKVTDELVNRFLDEDIKDRQNQARETSLFLQSQLELLEKSLVEQEKEIAEFRAANGDVRPEFLAFNQQAAASTLMSMQNIESQITANLGTQGTLRAQLAATSPYSRTMADGQILTTPAIQLKALQSEYATLTAKYGAEHPDVIKTRRQIAALKPLVGDTTNTAVLQAKIADAKARLMTAEKTNGPDHPDVKSIQEQLAGYEKQLSQQPDAIEDAFKSDADNPAYLQLVTQLRAAQEQHESLLLQKEAIKKEQEKYRGAVAQNPVVEQQFAALSRDYDNAQIRYRELKDKKMQADMSQAIEQGRSGQRLVLTNPPELPMGTQPSRKIFLLAGFMLSLACGFVSVFAVQLLSQSVIGPRQLAGLVGVEPLVCVPHILTNEEQKKKKEFLYLLKQGIEALQKLSRRGNK